LTSAGSSLVTYRNLIAANRRNSAILIATLLLLFGLVGSAVSLAIARTGDPATLLPSAAIGAGVALAVGSLASLWSWFGGGTAILRMAGARPIRKEDDPQLFNVVEELAISGGLPMPEVWIIDDPALNAFATGRDPAHAAVAITRGLRERLTRGQLAGVMAHELAHVRSYDIRFSMLMATLVGLVAFASDLFLRVGLRSGMRGGGRSSGGGKGGNPVAIVFVVLAVVLLILAPFVAMALRMAFSRQREYLADAGAVELTRDPQGLIDALRALGASRTPLARTNVAIAPLFMVEPAKAAGAAKPAKPGLFDTHPPLEERIRRLEALL